MRAALHRFVAAIALALTLFGAAQPVAAQRIVARPTVTSTVPPGLRLFASAAVTAEIWLTWGDSLNVGIDVRNAGVDLDWPGVYQVRQRSPTGISSDISPLDQAISPDGSDYLSPHEYFGKQRKADVSRDVYLVAHGWNGTSLGAGSGNWSVGSTLYESFITRANAAIQTVQSAVAAGGGRAVLAGIIQYEGTNDAIGGTAKATYKAALTTLIADMRSRIYQNGVSGADASSLPYIINGQMPEGATGSTAQGIEFALREVAASLVGGKFYKMAEGLARGDNIHPSAAGNRIVGPGNAGLLTDVTGPTTSFGTAYTSYASRQLLLEIPGNEYFYPLLSGAGASNYETVWVPDGATGLSATRGRWFLRWASNGTKSAGTYTVDVGLRDGAGNVTTVTHTDTVVTNSAQISPVSFFANGEKGIVWDLEDSSTLFQSRSCTGTAATAANDPVGCVLDKSPNGNNWVSDSDARRPLLGIDSDGKHYLSFNGSSYMLRAAPYTLASDPSFTAVVGLYGASQSAEKAILASTNAGGSAPVVAIESSGGTSNLTQWLTGTSPVLSGALDSTKRVITSAFSNLDRDALRRKIRNAASRGTNGAGDAYTTIDSVAVTTPVSTASSTLGSWASTTPSDFYSGRVYSGFIINRYLTDPEIAAGEDWIAARTLTTTLAANDNNPMVRVAANDNVPARFGWAAGAMP